MAKKKPKPGGDSPKRRRPADLSHLPDPRTFEQSMRQLIHSQAGKADSATPSAQAQEIMSRAFQERDEKRRVALAKEALALCPDCADAYVLLAEHAPSRRQALPLYRQGVAAGERSLGPEVFQRDAGHFWSLLETRPYMRARLGLAHILWTMGRRDEVIEHLQDMLRLNPGDNQGVRYTLAGFLLFLDRDAELTKLLRQYPEEASTAWAYTEALLAFRHEGDTLAARRLLKQAKKANKYVPDYLLGRKFPPNEPTGYYRPGDESDALNYVSGFMAGWKSTPGAVAWLRANDETTRKRKKELPHGRGPLALVKRWLKEKLTLQEDVWQADCRPMPEWMRIADETVRPWAALVLSCSDDLILASELFGEAPSSDLLWDGLVQAMQHPSAGKPHRPGEIQVRADERWQALRPHLEEIGVRLVVKDELDLFQEAFTQMAEHVCGKPRPGLLDMPGVTPRQVASFFEAAAAFFLQAPWKKVGYESAIKIESDQFKSGPYYGVLMGQSGLSSGLAVYEDLNMLKRLWEGDSGDEENARRSVGTSVMFGEETEIPVADLEAARRHGWKVARDDAYPSVFRKERGLSIRPPLAWELELMESCLRAVPDFVQRRAQEDPTREEMVVMLASGERKLVLSWVTDLEALPQG